MILHHLTHAGSVAFPNEIIIDFDALPPLIAISGPNGAGKTTLMDLIAACLVGEMPNRPGALWRNFVADGSVNLEWSMEGNRFESEVKVSPSAQKVEGSLWLRFGPLGLHFGDPSTDTDTVEAGPLWRDYRREILKTIGSPELFLASAYATQSGVGSFLKAPRADRKALLSGLLGLARYALLHERAKTKERAADLSLEKLKATIEELEVRLATKPDLDAKHLELSRRHGFAQQRLAAAHDTVRQANELAAQAREQRAALEPLKAELQGVELELLTMARRLNELDDVRQEIERTISRAPELMAAEARSAVLGVELAALDEHINEALNENRTIKDAMHRTELLDKDLRQATTDHARLNRQASTISSVPCKGEGVFAECRFLSDAHEARTNGLPDVETRISVLQGQRAGVVVPVRRYDLLVLQDRKIAAQRALAALQEPLSLGPRVEAARATRDALEASLEALNVDLQAKVLRRGDLRDRLETLPSLDEHAMRTQRAANAAEEQRRQAQQDVGWMARELGMIEGQLATLAEAEVALGEATAHRGSSTDDLADWALLTKAFGPSGIPALLIDQALPELSRLATDMLRECFGEEKFSIKLVTQRESADGEKLLETLDVVILRYGEPQDASTLSGGESVLVAEGLALAISLYQAGRSGRKIQTLLRDETDAALKEDLGPAYVRLLKKAGQMLGCRHVLFISHNAQCLELADARLDIRNGKITVS